jgi:hypothetical protein
MGSIWSFMLDTAADGRCIMLLSRLEVGREDLFDRVATNLVGPLSFLVA